MALLAAPILLLLAAACAATQTKRYDVDVRVPLRGSPAKAARARLVLVAADALGEANLSRTENIVIREKVPLARVLLLAAADRMRAAGIEPLEAREAARSQGRLVVVLTRLEARLEGRYWFASAGVRAERAGPRGRPVGRWKAVGRGSHEDTRILGRASGLAMGRAIAEALDRLPWAEIAGGGGRRLDRRGAPPRIQRSSSSL